MWPRARYATCTIRSTAAGSGDRRRYVRRLNRGLRWLSSTPRYRKPSGQVRLSGWHRWPIISEAERQRDIHQTLSAGIGCSAFVGSAGRDLPESRRVGKIHGRVRRRKVIPLERILEIEPELGGGPLFDLPLLGCGELAVDEALPVESIAADI